MPKRRLAACVIVLTLGSACGGEEAALPTPTPTSEAGTGGGITEPIDRSRDTVDQLNEQQRQREQDTGDPY
jgi:hypothetical protein